MGDSCKHAKTQQATRLFSGALNLILSGMIYKNKKDKKVIINGLTLSKLIYK